MLKKLCVALLIFVLVFSMAACNGETGTAGAESVPGITDTEILLGTVLPVTGVIADMGTACLAGMQYAFDQCNVNGGVKGRQLVLKNYDDNYNAAQALQAVTRLIEQDEVFIISGADGTQNSIAMLPVINQYGIPLIGGYMPAEGIGTMDQPYVFNPWVGFDYEFYCLADFAVAQGAQKVVGVMLTGDVSEPGIEGAEMALAKHGMKLDKVYGVTTDMTDYSGLAMNLKDSGADWILTINIPSGTASMLREMHKLGYYPKVAAQSDHNDKWVYDGFSEDIEGLYMSTKVRENNDPAMVDFVEQFSAEMGYAPTCHTSMGYLMGLLTIEALNNAEELTREGVIESLNNMTGFETPILPPITFGADIRQGNTALGIVQCVDGKASVVQDFKSVVLE